jgi:hypothetical protein
VPENVRDALPFIAVVALVCGAAVLVVARPWRHRVEVALLTACVLLIVGITQVGSEERPSLENPLAEPALRRAFTWWAARPDVFPLLTAERAVNVAIFVPVGLLLVRITRRWWWSLLAVAAFSFLIESAQAATRGRVADAVDVALNSVGGLVGVLVVLAVARSSSPRVGA